VREAPTSNQAEATAKTCETPSDLLLSSMNKEKSEPSRSEESKEEVRLSVASEVNPLALRLAFPDAQGLLDVKYRSLEEVKTTCLVVVDASVMLQPYVMETVTLTKVVEVYRHLTSARLIVPAQAAREFAKNRSAKIGYVLKHLREQASRIVPPIKKTVGFLAEDTDFHELQEISKQVGDLASRFQKKVATIASRIGSEIGRDPVSDAYREVLKGCVRDVDEPMRPDWKKKGCAALKRLSGRGPHAGLA
jgi:hypothetical protein